nr:immunoglobulin heavy chain junction region [Mus musculus]NSM04288.1 immunoglobulin heavy chain junction region [Mus musculus]NSM04379.1 immunoglobulin heavy chain junction region [Mus musculus]NSM04455.1 immunoglobulin heavy chain junction region [Mus musculus]NSM04943.1 immunoglobulin heavy chain junction region [Mus musculus]
CAMDYGNYENFDYW